MALYSKYRILHLYFLAKSIPEVKDINTLESFIVFIGRTTKFSNIQIVVQNLSELTHPRRVTLVGLC